MAPNPPETPAAAMVDNDALPAGTRFGELEILRVLGIGGFGIVYLAQDHALERHVALKEYMPSSLAGRGNGQMVSIRSGAHAETYALGLRSFVNEARLLARFNHPSLVKVYRFWEENGTAYMVMPYLRGRTLREVRRAMSTAPSESWMRSIVSPLLDALEQLHREDVYHRDIAPDNILLPPGELPVLLDFGAARRAIGDRTQTFTAILKPSYAPIEQYAEVVQLRQGPWTDLYALGAVIYYLLRGAPPQPATARAVQDDLPMLNPGDYPDISPQFIAAVEWALAIRPADRPQNIAALREVLEGRAAVPPRARAATTAPPRTAFAAAGDVPTYVTTQQLQRSADEAAAMELTRPMTTPPPTQPPPSMRATPSFVPSRHDEATAMPTRPTVDAPPMPALKPRSRAGWVVAGLGAFVVLAAGAAWMLAGRTPPASPEPVSAGATSELRVPAASPVVTRDPTPVPATAPTTMSSDTPPARTAAPQPKDPAVATTAPTDSSNAPATVQPPRSSGKPPRSTEAAPALASTHENAKPVPRVHAPAHNDEALRASLGESPQAPAAPAPNEVARDGPATPRQACGARVFLALALCLEEQCERPRFKSHPQCRKVNEMVERRRRGEGGD